MDGSLVREGIQRRATTRDGRSVAMLVKAQKVLNLPTPHADELVPLPAELIGDVVSLFRVFGIGQGFAHMPRERVDEGSDGTFYAL
jgi:hypothetical protein